MDYPVIDLAGTGNNIRNIIRDSTYTVADVADYLGTTQSLVYRYMSGSVLPSTDRLLALSVLLDVPMNDLLSVS